MQTKVVQHIWQFRGKSQLYKNIKLEVTSIHFTKQFLNKTTSLIVVDFDISASQMY